MSLKVTQIAIVTNPKGLHLRPAGLLAQVASQYRSRIFIIKDGLSVDARSLLDLITLVATAGSEVTITAEGDDAEAAVQAIVEFLRTDRSDE
jgi:phosphotransferase system HPr (HPr) family protein